MTTRAPQTGKHTAPIRLATLRRVRFLRGQLGIKTNFIIADFVTSAVDQKVRQVIRQHKIELPPEIAFNGVSKS